jgi:hypothetical protein
MGGFNSVVGFTTPLDTVEMYDATTDKWTAKKPMPTGRGDFALVSCCCCLQLLLLASALLPLASVLLS